MDSAPSDSDVKLYKASSEILEELQIKLPTLFRSPNGQSRRWIIYHKTSELTRLLDSFQEWPQLLDPHLSNLMDSLVSAFLHFSLQDKGAYLQDVSKATIMLEQLPRAICRLLYTLCKVRGYKIIVRLFNNEPKYIEPLLLCFRTWNQPRNGSGSSTSWEERYIMLLWLSHLMLAPFKLATISGFATEELNIPSSFLNLSLPEVAKTLLNIAFQHLYAPGKERESASRLIVRLSLREDMQKLKLPEAITNWCLAELKDSNVDQLNDQYRYVGLLTLMYGLMNASTSSEAMTSLPKVFNMCGDIANGKEDYSVACRKTAPSRKLVVKIVRVTVVHALSLVEMGHAVTENQIESMIEEAVQVLLELLADTDTPVRQAASKALATIILKLDGDLAAEVIEAVLACLNENILLEEIHTGNLSAATDLINIDPTRYKKNVNAVNALRWHGAMLTLSHALFKRSPPPNQLPEILDALLAGLTFEQRSSVGTSLGVSVRDAACFGIWSLARKYTTQEVNFAEVSIPSRWVGMTSNHCTLQKLATELVLASCLDPSGNLRRGASAALQELIGRHPDVVMAGIPLVQCVDYHAVARRSNAILEVAKSVAQLHETYHTSLLYACIEWRGCRAVDAESRRQAATTVYTLLFHATAQSRTQFSKDLLSQIFDLKPNNVGANAAARHGLLLSLAATLRATKQSLQQSPTKSTLEISRTILTAILQRFEELSGTLTGRMTADLIIVLEAVARVISEFVVLSNCLDNDQTCISDLSVLIKTLDLCTTASEDSTLADEVAEANLRVFEQLAIEDKIVLCDAWLPGILPGRKSHFTCQGRLTSISRIFPLLGRTPSLSLYQERFAQFLESVVSQNVPIETKVNSMESVCFILGENCVSEGIVARTFASAIQTGLDDYTVDQRGDVGSLLRVASIKAFQACSPTLFDSAANSLLLQSLVRLSAEKLVKVRHAAWMCLKSMDIISKAEQLEQHEHQADVSGYAYYRQISQLLDIQALQTGVLQGLESSIAGGLEDVSQTASRGLISFIEDTEPEQRTGKLTAILNGLLLRLQTVKDKDDREVVPVLDTMNLLMEQYPFESLDNLTRQQDSLLDLIDGLQTKMADIPRIQSLIRLLSNLNSSGSLHFPAADRITRKLLHKWPRVRQAAVDAVFLMDETTLPMEVDWNAAPTAYKAEVVRTRKNLGLVGRGQSQES